MKSWCPQISFEHLSFTNPTLFVLLLEFRRSRSSSKLYRSWIFFVCLQQELRITANKYELLKFRNSLTLNFSWYTCRLRFIAFLVALHLSNSDNRMNYGLFKAKPYSILFVYLHLHLCKHNPIIIYRRLPRGDIH